MPAPCPQSGCNEWCLTSHPLQQHQHHTAKDILWTKLNLNCYLSFIPFICFSCWFSFISFNSCSTGKDFGKIPVVFKYAMQINLTWLEVSYTAAQKVCNTGRSFPTCSMVGWSCARVNRPMGSVCSSRQQPQWFVKQGDNQRFTAAILRWGDNSW